MVARVAFAGAVVMAAGTIAEAVQVLRTGPPARMILLDYHLPDARGFSGLLALQHVASSVPVVVVSEREEMSLVEAARALGAWGFLSKSLPIDGFVAQVRQIAAGSPCFPVAAGEDPATRAATLRQRIADLSRAQRSVVIALADGRSNKEIARGLGITEATVKAHLTSVFRKLAVSNRTQALLALGPLFHAGETTAAS